MFDIRRIQVHSFKEFLREYLMIVVGILTALGLEHLATTQHHNREAEESRQRIVAELRANLAEVKDAQAQNSAQIKPVVAAIELLRKEVEQGVARSEINRRLLERTRDTRSFSYSWPSLHHEAWDVAVANQSAGYIDADALRRYSTAYAAQRDSNALGLQGSQALLSSTRLLDAMTDLRLQRADPVEILKVFTQLATAVTAAQGNLGELQKALEAGLEAEPSAPR